jgi:hypothetical protein
MPWCRRALRRCQHSDVFPPASLLRWSALCCGFALLVATGCSPQANCGDAGAEPDGGGGGAGGAPSVGALAVGCGDPAPGALDYLDDMEDGDARILGRDGRVGQWYTYHDATEGTLNPQQGTTPAMETIAGQRCGTSAKAMRVTGSGFSDFGAGFGFSFRYDAGASMELPYDASRFRGVTFWGRIGETSIGTVRLSIGDKWSRPDGGVCTTTPSNGPNACYDTFGAPFTLTTTWQRFSIDFGQLQQQAFGLQRPALDTSEVMNLEIAIPAAAPVFDIWIDDVAFYQ